MYFNRHLYGRRLKVAAILPVIWFVYVYTDAYVTYQAGEAVQWEIPREAIILKIIMQTLSLIGGGILGMFVMGCDFGEKQ